MKNYLLLIFINTVFCLNASTVYLTIEVENAITNDVIFTFKELPTDIQSKIYSVDLVNNKVDLGLSVKDKTVVEIEYNHKKTYIYVRPSDKMTIQFDAQRFPADIKFSGRGAENNSYFNTYQNAKSYEYFPVEMHELDMQFDGDVYNQANKNSASTFIEWIEERKSKAIQDLKTEKDGTGMNQEIYQFIYNDIAYQAAIDKMAYIILHQDRFSLAERKQFDEYYRPVSGIYSQKEALMNHPMYVTYLTVYANYLSLIQNPAADSNVDFYEMIDKTFKKRSKYYLLSQLMLRVYEKTGKTYLGEKYFVAFKNDNPYYEYTATIEELYAGVVTLLEEVEAPNIVFKTLDGKTKRLSDYRGKVVYISFWASWCKPCIKGFQKSKTLRADLEKAGIVLLNVSIDKTEELWMPAYQKHKPLGVNVWASNLDKVRQDYELRSIPAYFIIDKNGKFAYLSDNANRDIIEEFKKIMLK